MRFSREQLEYIVDSSTTMYKKLPLELLWLDRFAKSDIVINMKRDKLGRLLSTKRDRLKVVKLKELDTIYVLCEDSKGGYAFYQYVLGILFPAINFVFDTSCGNHNITNTLLDNLGYDRYIVITDSKFEDLVYMSDISNAKKLMIGHSKSAIFFNPISIEEVLLSWKDLTLRYTSTLHDKIVALSQKMVDRVKLSNCMKQ